MHMVSVVLGIGFTNWKLDWLLPHYVPVRLAVQLRRNAKQDWMFTFLSALGLTWVVAYFAPSAAAFLHSQTTKVEILTLKIPPLYVVPARLTLLGRARGTRDAAKD